MHCVASVSKRSYLCDGRYVQIGANECMVLTKTTCGDLMDAST